MIALKWASTAAALMAVVVRSQSPESGSASSVCYVCGEGNEVGFPLVSVTNPVRGTRTTCAQLQEDGMNGLIDSETCATITDSLVVCNCRAASNSNNAAGSTSGTNSTPSETSETPATSPATNGTDTSTGGGEFPPCNVCGEGMEIGNPNGTFVNPQDQSEMTCSELDMIAQSGAISEMSCGFYPTSVPGCECTAISSGDMNTTQPEGNGTDTGASGGDNPPCNICGAGQEIGNQDGIFVNPQDQSEMKCSELDRIAQSGMISATNCGFLPSLVSNCECKPVTAANATDPAGNGTETGSGGGGNPPCNICGVGKEVGNPDGIFVNPQDQSEIKCSELDRVAQSGMISPTNCGFLPSLVTGCECQPTTGGDVNTTTPTGNGTDAGAGGGEYPPCNICGAGKEIGNPGGIFVNPQDQSEMTCSELDAVAQSGVISETNCGFLPNLVSGCECKPSSGSSTNNTAPGGNGTDAGAGGGEYPPCNICGEGKVVGNPDGIFVNPQDQSEIKCSELDQAAQSGTISADNCGFLPDLVPNCGCKAASSAPAGGEFPPCNICGNGKEVGNPEGIFTNPQDSTEMSCADFQQVAFSGVVSEDNCGLIPQFVPDCGCQPARSGFENPPCNICGNGNMVTKPDGIFVNPQDQSQLSCGNFSASAFAGAIPADQCGLIPDYVPDCGCQPVSAAGGSTGGASSAPTFGPGSHPSCNICGDNLVVTKGDGIINNPIDGTSPTCAQLDRRGQDGAITVTFCMMLPAVVQSECGCALPDGVTYSPTPDPTSGTGQIENVGSALASVSLLLAGYLIA